MKLLIDRNPEEEDVVISLAQELWCEIHGPARISGKQWKEERLDAHKSKKSKPEKGEDPTRNPGTERGWLQSRRQAVTEAIEHRDGSSITMPDMEEAATHPAWSDNHTKELQWQMEKLRKRKAEAFERELLLDGEVDDKVRMTAVELQKQLEKVN